MYLALYRKFRPSEFEGLIGQEHITRTLRNQIERGQIGHAYLFCGSRGTGKTSTAKIFARAINCEHPVSGSPCGECATCQSLRQSSNIDIVEIDAASNNGVDEIRDLREKVKYAPSVGKYKVYIIDEVHMLSVGAFNALLKTLEEPPSHAVFILATTEVHKLPATILSRVMRFDFKLISTDEIATHLTHVFDESGFTYEPSAVKLIAAAGEGSVRDALSIADMCASFCDNNITYQGVVDVLGMNSKDVILSLVRAILTDDIAGFFNNFHSIVSKGKNLALTTSEITKAFRDMLVIKSCGADSDLIDWPADLKEELVQLCNGTTIGRINHAMLAFSNIESELKYTTNPQLLIEATAMSLLSEDAKKN